MPAAFDAFKAAPEKPITITVSLDEMSAALGGIRANRVDLRLEGADEQALLELLLVHTGVATLRHPRTGEVRTFTHDPRAVVLYQSADPDEATPPGDNLGGIEGEFAYLSPAAVWTLRVTSAQAAAALADLTAIHLDFTAFGYARADL
jgi:hypothetical protein